MGAIAITYGRKGSELLNITEVVVHSGYATARLALVVG